MKNMMDIGFWLDLLHRMSGIASNMFRWTFATKRRLQMVLLGLIIVSLFWGCARTSGKSEADANAPSSTASATATAPPCVQPEADTDAEKNAAGIVFSSCSVPNYKDTRRSAASRALTVTIAGASPEAPPREVAQRFSEHLPNAVEQIGGADETGVTTVLATSSESQFLLSFDAAGSLVKVRDITDMSDATPAPNATGTPTPPTTQSATDPAVDASPTPTTNGG